MLMHFWRLPDSTGYNMELKKRVEQLEKRVRMLEREKHIMNDNLTDQARLIISLGKKVMKRDASLKDDSNFNKKIVPIEAPVLDFL